MANWLIFADMKMKYTKGIKDKYGISTTQDKERQRTNLWWQPLLSNGNGYPSISTTKFSNCLVLEDRIWVSIQSFIESEGPVFWNKNAGDHHCCQFLSSPIACIWPPREREGKKRCQEAKSRSMLSQCIRGNFLIGKLHTPMTSHSIHSCWRWKFHLSHSSLARHARCNWWLDITKG